MNLLNVISEAVEGSSSALLIEAMEDHKMPSANPYDLLKGYCNPDNKTRLQITLGDKVYGTFKPQKASTTKGGIVIYGKQMQKPFTSYKVTIDYDSFLSAMLGTKVPAISAEKDGFPLESNKVNKKNEIVPFKLAFKSYEADKNVQYKQYQAQQELISLYYSMNEEQRGRIDTMIAGYKQYEEDLLKRQIADIKAKHAKAIAKGDEWDDDTHITKWAHTYDSIENALGGFVNSLLFPVGNAKVSNDTLLVNMNSAVECPSRVNATCLVGTECYALNDAKMRFGIRHRDRMLHLANTIWLMTGHMDSLKDLIKVYIQSARNYGFNIQNIRLNEAGDFIDQDAIDEYSRICGELRDETGVQATAYTARTKDKDGTVMNFSSTRGDADENGLYTAPNIVITASRAEDEAVTNKEGVIPGKFNPETGEVERVDAVALADRYFLAIPESDFFSLPDTRVNTNGIPNLLQNDHFKTKLNPEGWFHKCQCEIDKNRTCGDCHVCYTPNYTGQKYYILCKAHGTFAKSMEGQKGDDLDKTRHFSRPFGNVDGLNKTTPEEGEDWTPSANTQMRKQGKGKWFTKNQSDIEQAPKGFNYTSPKLGKTLWFKDNFKESYERFFGENL